MRPHEWSKYVIRWVYLFNMSLLSRRAGSNLASDRIIWIRAIAQHD